MSANTSIEWTEKSWNPIAAFLKRDITVIIGGKKVTFPKGTRGWFCVKCSPGCLNCYAEGINLRLGNGLEYLHRNLADIEFRLVNLEDPLKWRKPCMVFVNSMTDLFLEHIPDGMIDRVLAVIQVAQEHTFQILTKRAQRMRDYFGAREERWLEYENEREIGEDRFECDQCGGEGVIEYIEGGPSVWGEDCPSEENHMVACPGCREAKRHRQWFELRNRWPLPNIWLGVSVEDQPRADERIPILLRTSAAIRFLSCEPLLGPINIGVDNDNYAPFTSQGKIDWVIVGGESGSQARPCNVQWIRDIVAQCKAANVPIFVKQLGSEPGFTLEDEEARGNPCPSYHHFRDGLYIKKLDDRKGGDPNEWPEDLRIREFPDCNVAVKSGV